VLQGAAGLLAIIALVFTARTYLLGREGQVTDRYTKAVDQLGAKTLEQRTGGVFALERIMRDPPKDHWNVVEVLAAFARSADREAAPKRPDADVKAALTVLGRRPARQARELDRIRLSDADLRETLMRHGRLDRAALRGAWLENVHWEHASLVGARLRKAHMRKADLEQANLHKAGLQGADLTGAKLHGAILADADLTDATLQGAQLENADLSGAHLAGVKGTLDLSAAQLAQVHCRPNVDRCPDDRPSESTTDSPAPP
jgi:hypothetical protein